MSVSPENKSRLETTLPIDQASRFDRFQQGHWRQVRPDELLRRPIDEPAEPEPVPAAVIEELAQPKVALNRRQQLEQHLKESPTDRDAFLELGRIYRAENRPADARRILEQAVEIFPDDTTMKWEYEEAILARSLQQLRETMELAQRLGTTETDRDLKRCRDDWANRRMEICRARLGRDPSLTHLRIVMAEALHDAGRHAEAIDELEPVFEHDELSPTAYLIQGQCLLSLDQPIDAIAALRAAALRRAVPAPIRLKIAALRLLCNTAKKLGITLTLQQYQQHLHAAEQDLAIQMQRGAQ